MIKFEKRVSIARPQQEVFDYFVDPSKQPEWVGSTESSEWITDPPHGVGSRSRDVNKFLGRRIETESEVTLWEEPDAVASKFTKPFPGEFTARLSTQGDVTELTMSVEAEAGGFFRIAEGLVGRQLERSVDADLNALKLILESR